MELVAIAILIVAAILLIWTQWIKPRRLDGKRQLNGYQSVKSTYLPTFEAPGQNTGGRKYSPTTPASPHAARVTATRGHDAPARLVRDISTILSAHSMAQMSGSQTVAEFTETQLWTAIARSGGSGSGASGR